VISRAECDAKCVGGAGANVAPLVYEALSY
jgi:hypothetical protein